MKIVYDPSLSLKDIEKEIKKAFQHRKHVKAISESLCLEYRTRLAQAKEDAGENNKAAYLRQLNNVEKQRRLFRNIKYMEDRIKSLETTKVITIEPDGSTREHSSRQSVEDALLDTHREKYHQTEGSSGFLTPEGMALFGSFGEGPRVIDVLEGSFQSPPFISPATNNFFLACKRDTTVNIYTPSLGKRFQAYKDSWSYRKEGTVSINHHMGHYKAVIKDSLLSWLFFQRSNIPLQSGYSPDRHRKGTDLVLDKNIKAL